MNNAAFIKSVEAGLLQARELARAAAMAHGTPLVLADASGRVILQDPHTSKHRAVNVMMRTRAAIESRRDYLRIERVVMRAAGHEMTPEQEERLDRLSALLLAYDAGRASLTRSRLVDADRRETKKAESRKNPKRRDLD